MVLIVGLFAGLALFFAWLSGGWFARALVFLLAWPVLLVVLCNSIFGYAVDPAHPLTRVAFFELMVASGFGAWIISSLPIFLAQRRLRHQLIAPNYGAGRDIRRSLP